MKERIHLFCLERKTTRVKKICAVLKISGFVWTGPKLFFSHQPMSAVAFPFLCDRWYNAVVGRVFAGKSALKCV